MGRWLTACVLGILLTAGQGLVAQEEDPFAEAVAPEISEPPVSALDVTPLRREPIPYVPPIRRPRPPVEPTVAQQKVVERAAQEARSRKARIEQRKYGTKAPAQAFFPSEGRLSGPSLFHIDPGIRVAFRPITLSGLEPIPAPQPRLSAPVPKPVKPVTIPKNVNPPRP